MKQSRLFLALLSISWPLAAMQKSRECCKEPARYMGNLITAGKTAFALRNVTRTYAPLCQKEAKDLFAQKGIKAIERLNDLENDEHIVAVAQKAGLQKGITIFATQQDVTEKLSACTGSSITTYRNGTIAHAIGVPKKFLEKISGDQKQKVLCGIIEREIARITHAYTHKDERIQQLKISAGSCVYFLLSLAIGMIDLNTTIATIPFGLVGTSLLVNRYDLGNEISCDLKAAELAGTAAHLMATLEYSDHFPHLAAQFKQEATTALSAHKSVDTLHGDGPKRMYYLIRHMNMKI